MKNERKVSIWVGILYILGTVFGILSVVLMGNPEPEPLFLRDIAMRAGFFRAGLGAILLMGLSLSIIPILLYGVLSRYSKPLAIAYVVFRSGLEFVTFLLSVFASYALLFIALSPDPSSPESFALGSLFHSLGSLPLSAFIFSVDAFILYYAFFRTRLIPRWLSAFGLAAIALHFITGCLMLFGIQTSFSPLNTLMNFPIFLQEMVMAVLLIAKGFDTEALARLETSGYSAKKPG